MADTTVNFHPTAEELAEITLLVAKEVRNFNIIPRIAMLSYSNFGSSNSEEARLGKIKVFTSLSTNSLKG